LQARDAGGKFLSKDGTSLAGPGKIFENSVANAFRAKGDKVFQNVTIRDASGNIVSYGDSIVVRNGKVRFVAEAKSSETAKVSKGQQKVQEMIANGEPLTFTGPSAAGIPGAGSPIILPNGTYQIITPGMAMNSKTKCNALHRRCTWFWNSSGLFSSPLISTAPIPNPASPLRPLSPSPHLCHHHLSHLPRRLHSRPQF
jgi:hypothetical protein